MPADGVGVYHLTLAGALLDAALSMFEGNTMCDIESKEESGGSLVEALSAIGRDLGLTNGDIDFINGLRDKTPAEPLTFDES